MKVQAILDELKYIGDGAFPEHALSQAVAKRDEISPHLLRVLEQSKTHPEQIIAQPGYILHVYALFLLAQFKEQRAYDSVVDLVALPAQQVDDLLGDVVSESLMRILASLGGGDTNRLRSLVENQGISPYVRGAALYTFVILVARKMIPREAAIDYFRSLLQKRLERKRGHLWAVLISCCLDVYGQELRADIKNAYLSNLVDNKLVGEFSVVQKTFAESQDSILKELENNPQYQLIDDTVMELRRWAAFNKQADETIKMKKVGRNMSCPCGSGKKYKHCCLHNINGVLPRQKALINA